MNTAPLGAVFAFTDTTHIDTGEPDAVKAARPVRRGADGKVLRATGVTRRRPTLHENRQVSDHEFQQDLREFAELPAGTATTVFYEIDPRTRPRDHLGDLEVRWVNPDTGDRMTQDHRVTHSRESGRRPDPRLQLGAIVALTADRHAALAHPDSIPPGQVSRQILHLQDLLENLRTSLDHLDSYHDLQTVLDHMTRTPPWEPRYDEVPKPPSGYAP